ncbi:hypothetical protein L596_006847 [Steinernema carpocapsae]|uniref:Uncharacterized protein n=1 Tax=Steinernema carpocapsae TaxID=34508 RepID=A0A4V6A5W9_STECR|nr:hypothetical protein L596_006847 [Steinernema carpocapsae]
METRERRIPTDINRTQVRQQRQNHVWIRCLRVACIVRIETETKTDQKKTKTDVGKQLVTRRRHDITIEQIEDKKDEA